jgi:hypothetical protein
MNKLFIARMQRSPEGAGGAGGTEMQALLQKINENVNTELEKRGYQNKDAIENIFSKSIEALGLNVEQLRSFDAEKVQNSIKNIAGAVEQLKNNPIVGEQRMNAIKSLLDNEDNMKLVERAFEKGSGKVVILNTRAAVAAMTTTNVVIDGDIPEDILNSFSVDSFIKKRRPSEYIFDVADRATVGDITEYKTWLEEGDEEGAFAIVAEGAVKPLVSKTLVRNTTKYKKIAGKRVYTEEFAKFRKEAYRILEQLFNDQLLRNYAALLTTDLISKAASYVGTALDDQYTNPTDYHAVGAVAAQIESLDFIPDTLVLNPQDKWRIGLSQDTVGAFYVNIPMLNPSGELTMMGFRLVTSNRIPVGNALLGEGKLYKIEDEPVQIRLGYGINVTKNGDGLVTNVDSDVDTNRFRIIAETFFHSYIGTNYTGSFVYFNFAAVKAALLKP